MGKQPNTERKKSPRSTRLSRLAVSFILLYVTASSMLRSGYEAPPSTILSNRLEFQNLSGASTIFAGTITGTSDDLESLSSVEYFACCGLGHRLVRMSSAHFVAKLNGFSLRSFWGWCGELQPVEVFSYLFHPNRPEEVQHVRSRNVILPFYNEVPGFKAVERIPTMGNLTACNCDRNKIDADFELYTSLRSRFRNRPAVDAFVDENFRDKTVLGIHVRAGNGEKGDFVRKGRTIAEPEVWVSQVCRLLQEFVNRQTLSKPPILYIATDTPSMIRLFRNELAKHNIPVLDYGSEGRRSEGDGVLFGESIQVLNKDGTSGDDFSVCLQSWTQTLTDMFLLSHADVVIAGRPSSFVQTAPMSLAFGNSPNELRYAYCEIIPHFESQQGLNATNTSVEVPQLQCHSDYMEWCCNHTTWIETLIKGNNGHSRTRSKEFIRFPSVNNLKAFDQSQYKALRNRTSDCRRPRRGRAGGGLKDKCLPFEW